MSWSTAFVLQKMCSWMLLDAFYPNVCLRAHGFTINLLKNQTIATNISLSGTQLEIWRMPHFHSLTLLRTLELPQDRMGTCWQYIGEMPKRMLRGRMLRIRIHLSFSIQSTSIALYPVKNIWSWWWKRQAMSRQKTTWELLLHSPSCLCVANLFLVASKSHHSDRISLIPVFFHWVVRQQARAFSILGLALIIGVPAVVYLTHWITTRKSEQEAAEHLHGSTEQNDSYVMWHGVYWTIMGILLTILVAYPRCYIPVSKTTVKSDLNCLKIHWIAHIRV